MTLRRRLGALERARPDALTALDDLLAAVASRGLRIQERPAGPAATADPEEVTAWLEALRRTPSRRAPPREAQP